MTEPREKTEVLRLAEAQWRQSSGRHYGAAITILQEINAELLVIGERESEPLFFAALVMVCAACIQQLCGDDDAARPFIRDLLRLLVACNVYPDMQAKHLGIANAISRKIAGTNVIDVLQGALMVMDAELQAMSGKQVSRKFWKRAQRITEKTVRDWKAKPRLMPKRMVQ